MPTFSKLKLSDAQRIHLRINVGCLVLLLWGLLISNYFFVSGDLSEAWVRIAERVPSFYIDNLRGDFFMAFVSVGAFLLSLKTFIVLTMKKELFDTEAYKKVHEKMSSGGDVGGLYAPLKQLNDYIYWAILMSLLTAVLQVTLGFFPYLVPVVICISMAMASSVYLVWSLVLVKRNLDRIIDSK